MIRIKYAKSLLKIWSTFSLFWGTASLWSRCKYGTPNSCNDPMITFGKSTIKCRDLNCIKTAERKFMRSNHDAI